MAQTDALRPYQPAAPTQLGEDRRYLRNELDKLSASISSVRDVMQGLETSLNTDTANIATNTTNIAGNTASIATLQSDPHGQCRLVFTDATHITLQRLNGSKLTANGVQLSVPSAGAVLTNAGLSASTLYYIYAKDGGSGVAALEASTTGHATNTDGAEIKSGDPTRTLVGMARTDGSAQFTTFGVVTWFNKRLRSFQIIVPSSITTSSTTFVSAGASSQTFLCWADIITMSAASIASSDTVGGFALISCGVDGSAFSMTGGAQVMAGATNSLMNLAAVGSVTLSEGAHTASIMVAQSGGTATYYAGDTGYTVTYFG